MRSMHWLMLQTCTGFGDQEGFLCARLSVHKLRTRICKDASLYKISEIRGPE
jgi:hypothetical protein